jgi:phage baseplate assembly protein W
MRPDFGSGLLGLVFEPGGPELVAATQHLVQGALQQELGHLIAIESVEVAQDEGALTVAVSYVALQTQERASAAFSRRLA